MALQIALPPLFIQQKIVEILDLFNFIIDKSKLQFYKLDLLVKSRFVEMFGDPFNKKEKYPKQKIAVVIDTNIAKVNKIFNSDDIIKYIDISSIDNKSNKIINYSDYIVGNAPSRAQQIVRVDDLLISTVRPNLKNVTIIRDRYKNLVASTGFFVLRPTEIINKEYLFFIIKTTNFTNYLSYKAKGANYPAVNGKDIMDFEIPLPPLSLQNKFAEFVQQADKSKICYAEGT
jgi:restriction endonuclease S subunit